MSETLKQDYLVRIGERRAELGRDLASLYPDPVRLTLEIGCGHGHWLVDYADQFREKRCLGVDLVGDRIERSRRKAQRFRVPNVSFLKAEAFETLGAMPAWVALDEIFVLFPDPWPKKRHWKNRLLNGSFLSELGNLCSPGTRCHFRTDHVGYFQWALEIVDNHALWSLDASIAWPFERETVFQSKADAYQSMILVRTQPN